MAELAVVSGVGAERYLPRFDAATYDSYVSWFEYCDEVEAYENRPRLTAAWNLLKDFLTTTQNLSLSCRKVVELEGSMGGQYILHDKARHLYRIDKPRRVAQAVCFHEADEGIFPLDDIILTKLLWIQSDEEKFRWHSNTQEMRYGRDWYVQFMQEIVYMRLVSALMLAIFEMEVKDDLTKLVTLSDESSRFKAEYDNLVDIYTNYPRLLWRLIDRFRDHLDKDHLYLLEHLPENLARTEAYYAK